ncbi:MAG: hypothetical protein MR466_09700 [Ruminococcus sp.]|nr:hypothetical protein [Ruminococcus sp.]
MQMSKDQMTTYISDIINDIYTRYEDGYTVPSIVEYLKNDIVINEFCKYIMQYARFNNQIISHNYMNRFKNIIADFAGIDIQNDNDEKNNQTDPIVFMAVEALVKAYDLKELAAKVNALPAFDTQQNDSFEQFQPAIHAFMDAYDIDTAAAFNTKIYQLIASDIQDSKTNSALQQQLAALCNQVETLTGQVQQLSEQIQQLKNPPTKSE